MIYSMDELGFENHEKIIGLRNETEKWTFITDIARTYGFDGIHITPSLYESFGLDVNNIPFSMKEFHLSYHLGGLVKILTENDCSEYEKVLSNALDIAVKYEMKDISLHPPVIEDFSENEKVKSAILFSELIKKWSAYAIEKNIMLSLETHFYEPYFLFGNLEQYINFCDPQDNMGILIDISHNYFGGYSEQNLIDIFEKRNVKALHVSDALQLKDEDLKLGTHLAVGDGKIDFEKLLPHFTGNDIFMVLEIKSSNIKLKESLEKLKNITN